MFGSCSFYCRNANVSAGVLKSRHSACVIVTVSHHYSLVLFCGNGSWGYRIREMGDTCCAVTSKCIFANKSFTQSEIPESDNFKLIIGAWAFKKISKEQTCLGYITCRTLRYIFLDSQISDCDSSHLFNFWFVLTEGNICGWRLCEVAWRWRASSTLRSYNPLCSRRYLLK